MGVRVLPTPVRAPKGSSSCERIVRTARRECLDFMIPLSEGHLHYNHGRLHKSLGPGIPLPLDPLRDPSERSYGIPDDRRVRAQPVLGGLHHECSVEKLAA